MALKRAQAGGSESTEIFTNLVGSTVVMRIVRYDGKRPGQNGEYDVVTAHVFVIDGPHQYEFHKNLSITNTGVVSALIGKDIELGDDIIATIGTYKSFGKNNPAANEPSEIKAAEVEAMFAEGDPFEHYLGNTGDTANGMTTRPTQTVPPVMTGTNVPAPSLKSASRSVPSNPTGAKVPPWKK